MKKIFLSFLLLNTFFIVLNGQTYRYDLQATTIIAQSGYYQLTEGDLNASMEFMEFILTTTVTLEDRQAAQANLVQQFQINPMGIAMEVQNVRQALPFIASLTDITQIANYRNSVITNLYLQFFNNPNRPILLQLMDKYNPILMYDALYNICLTDRDIHGLLTFTQFGYELMGQSPPAINPTDKQQLVQQLEVQIYSMSKTDKQNLLLLADYVPLMKQAFQQMTPTQQEPIRQQYLQALMVNQNTNQSEQNCQGCSAKMKALYAKQARGEMTQYDLAEMQREIDSQQNMFTMMNNMSLENHATMLNVINNLGGGNTTYEVKYNDY